MKWSYALFFLTLYIHSFSQTLAPSRSVDWTIAGLRDTSTINFVTIDMQSRGANGNSVTPNDSVMSSVLSTIGSSGTILYFPAGNYLFNQTINLPNHVILKGQGAGHTIFTMYLGGSGDAISVKGSLSATDTSSLAAPVSKDSSTIQVINSTSFNVGDWIQITQNDIHLVTSAWATGSVGQMAKIKRISPQGIELESPLRLDLDTVNSPYITKVIPAENVGIECLKIKRIDDTAPQQSSSIDFTYAVNCWIHNVESENCTFSHVLASKSSNLKIANSYFHHGFSYGSGGRAYGVTLQATTNECLVENNIFEHLRHSMLLQSGANGNVFAYNYSFSPFWTTMPSNAAGDLVLHGNYPFANLFEQNIGQNIVIDNSHGPNGPHNTFFRNRAESFGIFFSANNSPNQNLIGNEITNTQFPYSLVNYTIQGSGHFIHGNNNKGSIHPAGTSTLNDDSYAYLLRPSFVPSNQWAAIGTPNAVNSGSIPAKDRYQASNIFGNGCRAISTQVQNIKSDESIQLYPNPSKGIFHLSLPQRIENAIIEVRDLSGKLVHQQHYQGLTTTSIQWNSHRGIYFLTLKGATFQHVFKVIKN